MADSWEAKASGCGLWSTLLVARLQYVGLHVEIGRMLRGSEAAVSMLCCYCRGLIRGFISRSLTSRVLTSRVLKSLNQMIVMFAILFGLQMTVSEPAEAGFSWWMWTPGDTVDHPGYKPTQPIPFSHKLHAGDKEIPCQYCHSSARRSITGGIPPLNTCMGCHRFVATDKDPIKYITEKHKKNEPMEWVKVHDIPDFVRFSHKIHVGAKLECQECHGAVESMEVVEQVAPMQMGWCLDCHREKKASTDCLTCHY